MEIVNKNLMELIPYDKNPRQNKSAIKYVAESIKEFGFKVPIVIDKNNVIVAGHTRFEASKKLGLTDVPCIIANDLTDEQIKAFRLADNKVSEKSKWDMDLLDIELDEIIDLDMSAFGFDLEKEEKPNERERTNNEYNLEIIDLERSDGFFQMPIISNNNFIPSKLRGFNYAKTSDTKDCGIHFYIDDYQFERIWNDPSAYTEILRPYECILSPDFSLYMDMPRAMKVWNIYRSRMIGQYYQDQGIKVIPTISWAERETFSFCFDGIPTGSIVSISTIGVKKDKHAMKVWTEGMDAMIEKIKPSKIVVYGGELEYNYNDIDVIYFENEVTQKMKGGI